MLAMDSDTSREPTTWSQENNATNEHKSVKSRNIDIMVEIFCAWSSKRSEPHRRIWTPFGQNVPYIYIYIYIYLLTLNSSGPSHRGMQSTTRMNDQKNGRCSWLCAPAYCPAPVWTTGGKPSTWFPPGGLVEQACFNKQGMIDMYEQLCDWFVMWPQIVSGLTSVFL